MIGSSFCTVWPWVASESKAIDDRVGRSEAGQDGVKDVDNSNH